MKTIRPLVSLLCLLTSIAAYSQSSSPTSHSNLKRNVQTLAANSSKVITFSEFPVGTTITDQYQNIGILFGPNTFITTDGSNPTSPVLSGTPRFSGNVSGTFVVPGTKQPTTVKAFTLDAGYFDNFGSTRIQWFDPNGNVLGQKTNSILGIETITVEGGNIASWTISIVANEPAGFAIDNFSFEPTNSSLIFRENVDSKKEQTWGFLGDEIPGWDHVGFQTNNVVYESHPGYLTGTYVSSDGKESRNIVQHFGVQSQHSGGTFKNDARQGDASPVVNLDEIPIDDDLAAKMRTAIESVSTYEFDYIDFRFPDGLSRTLSPAVQKGGNGAFTCVGLVEWSAEKSGYRSGQGFVPNTLESFLIPDPRNLLNSKIEIPLLSPQLLNYCVKTEQLVQNVHTYIQGLFDPVDFIITDPLGRKLGFSKDSGYFRQIPYALYPGDGDVEQILVPTVIPGNYTIHFIGTGDTSLSAVACADTLVSVYTLLPKDSSVTKSLFVKPTIGCLGDVNSDGLITQNDIDALNRRLNTFTDSLGDRGDLDGDGLISNNDVALLTRLVSVFATHPLQLSFAVKNVQCYNESNGSIDLTVSGGVAPYRFIWSNDSTTEDLSNLQAGTYKVTVTDANGSMAIDSAVVCQPQKLVVNIDVPGAKPLNKRIYYTSSSQDYITLSATATGGNGCYTYQWNNGATTQCITVPLKHVAKYRVTVTDANGCAGTDLVIILSKSKNDDQTELPLSDGKISNKVDADDLQLLSLYPNPARNYINLKLAAGKQASYIAKAEIVNTAGAVIKKLNLSAGDNFIDVSSLNSGLYFLKIYNSQSKIQYYKFDKVQ